MKKMNVVLVASLSFILSLSLMLGMGTPRNMVDRTMRSIVFVTFVHDDDQIHYCTGFVVSASQGRVLTANHCVSDVDVIQVDGVDALVMKRSATLALLAIKPMSLPTLDMQDRKPSIGDPAQAFGFGWGTMKVLSRHVSGFENEGMDIVLDGPLIQGMSGGPVIDAKGKVIGINQASNDILAIICGADEINAFLNSK